MKIPSGLFVILTSLLCTSSLPAWADPGYRIVPVTDDAGASDFIVTDLNRRGEVVGARSTATGLRGFRWRAGHFIDLHDIIDSTSNFTEAVAINDRSTIVGASNNIITESFEGFWLRGTQLSTLTVVPGESQVFPLDINNREQVIVSLNAAQSGSYLVDGDNVQFLEGLPGETDSMHAMAINERGNIAGNTRTAGGSRAVLWVDGTLMDLGAVSGATGSFVYALNDRQQVVGIASIGGGSQAVRWKDGEMTLLPRLVQDPAASTAAGINNWGMIVGSTIVVQPEFRSTATLWLGNHVAELDRLVRADDPLKPFVHLESGEHINDRGDIVVSGVDSRTPAVRTTYFLTLFDN